MTDQVESIGTRYPIGCIYIAGPMRGKPENNFPAFNAAASVFRHFGWHVFNPVEIGEQHFANAEDVPPEMYIRKDIEALAQCDAICILPGWQGSVGARCEVGIALTLGLQFFDEVGWPVTPPPLVLINGGYKHLPGRVESLDLLQHEVNAWGRETFGESTNYARACHLLEEAHELVHEPDDLEEMADIFMLISQCADGRLAEAVRAKLEKNKRRQWGTPDANGVVRHIHATREETP